jgi:hypothetical protein
MEIYIYIYVCVCVRVSVCATFSAKTNKRFNICNCYFKINSEDKYYVEKKQN